MSPNEYSTRDAFGRRLSIRRSSLRDRAAYLDAPREGITLDRQQSREAAEALLKSSGSEYRVIDPLTAYYGAPTGYLRPTPAPSAEHRREALRMAIDTRADGETPETTTRRARAYASYLSEGK